MCVICLRAPFLSDSKGGGPKKYYFFSSLLLVRGPATPPLVVPWAIKILGPYFNVALDAIGLEAAFTLETNRKN